MAYKIDTDLKNGLRASYWKLTSWEINLLAGEASGAFMVFVGREHAGVGGRPADQRIARVRVQGADFDAKFGSGRREGASDQEILYLAAAEIGVLSDFGAEPEPSDQKVKRGHRTLFKRAQPVLEDRSTPR